MAAMAATMKIDQPGDKGSPGRRTRWTMVTISEMANTAGQKMEGRIKARVIGKILGCWSAMGNDFFES